MKNIIIIRLDTDKMPKEKAKELIEETRQEVSKIIDDESIKILILPNSADISILPIA